MLQILFLFKIFPVAFCCCCFRQTFEYLCTYTRYFLRTLVKSHNLKYIMKTHIISKNEICSFLKICFVWNLILPELSISEAIL